MGRVEIRNESGQRRRGGMFHGSHHLRGRVHGCRGAGQQPMRAQQLGQGPAEVGAQVVVQHGREHSGAEQREVVGVEVVPDEGDAGAPGGGERGGDARVAAAHRVDRCDRWSTGEGGPHGSLGGHVLAVQVAHDDDLSAWALGLEPLEERCEPLLLPQEAAVAERGEHQAGWRRPRGAATHPRRAGGSAGRPRWLPPRRCRGRRRRSARESQTSVTRVTVGMPRCLARRTAAATVGSSGALSTSP